MTLELSAAAGGSLRRAQPAASPKGPARHGTARHADKIHNEQSATRSNRRAQKVPLHFPLRKIAPESESERMAGTRNQPTLLPSIAAACYVPRSVFTVPSASEKKSGGSVLVSPHL